MKKLLSGGLLALSVLCVACNDTFSPNGPYETRMVVYAIFSTETDSQYVRVYTTYPVATDPLAITTDTDVPDAQVTVTHGATVFTFRDTLLQRADTSRYRTPIRAHVGYGVRLTGGERYNLRVVSPSLGVATASGTALYSGNLVHYADGGDVIVRVYPSPNARAFIVRMYLEYEVRIDTTLHTLRTELPRVVDPNTGRFFYPRPTAASVDSTIFSADAINTVKAQVRQQYNGGSLRFRRTVFVLTLLDDALYAYYSTANGFPDSGTLRLDEPDYSNVDGALGVFAMISQAVAYGDTSGN